MDYASSPHDFKLMLAASGQRASDISQLGGGQGSASAPAAPVGGPGSEPVPSPHFTS